MFHFLPQFIALLSLGTVLVIVFRHIPDVTVRPDNSESSVSRPLGERVRESGHKIRQKFRTALSHAATYAAEAKDHSIRANYLGRFSTVLQFRQMTQRLKFPTHIVPKNQLREAEALARTSDATSAEQAFIKIIERDPTSREAYQNLGKLYIEQKKFREAQEVYEFLTRSNPADDASWSKLGMAYFNLGNFEGAAAAYREALQLVPDATKRLINLSLCYEAQGQTAEAVKAAEQAVENAPGNAQYLFLLGDFYIQNSQRDRAAETFELLLEIEPGNEAARKKMMELKFP